MSESEMEAGGSAIQHNSKPDTDLSYSPCGPRMLPHLNRGPGRIVCLGHGQRSRIAGDMHDPAIRKPSQQFRHMSDVDRKFHTGSLTTAKPRNFLDENTGDRSQTPIRLLDPGRDSLF